MDRLYSGSLDEFTAERAALAKRFRDAGEREAADQVAKLRKPTVAAWLVNRLVDSEGKAMQRFFAAAEDLQRAQEEALRGKGGEHLRRATKAEREAIERLVEIARRIGDGLGEATFDRVRETLEAAVTDEEAREAVRSGRLQRELRPAQGIPVPSGPETDEQDDDSGNEEALADAERELEQAQQELEQAEAEAKRRQEEVDQAQSELREAKAGLKQARAAARKAATQARSSERRLERLRKA